VELNGTFQTQLFYKIATGTDNGASVYNFTWTGNVKNVITLVAYNNVSGAAPTYAAAHGTSSPITSPTVADPSLADYTLVYIFTPLASMGTTSPLLSQWTLGPVPSDLFKNTNAGANNVQNEAVLTADVDKASPGSNAAKTATTSGLSSGNAWNAIVLVIHP
jgi:hypothetical protein